jgi:hypothetical protein
MKNKLLYLCFALYLFFLRSIASAEPLSDYFATQLSVSSQYTDNAARAYSNSEGIDERQDEYQMTLNGAYQNQWSKIATAYVFSDRQFSEASQPDERLVEGKGQFDLGSGSQPLHLMIEHVSDKVLNAPDAIDISSNRLNRQLLTIEPSVQWRMNDSDLVAVKFRRLTIDYDKRDENNSTTKSMDLDWTKSFSAVDRFFTKLTTNKTTFDINADLNYEIRNLTAGYAVDLRHLNYAVVGGWSRATQNGETLPFYIPKYNVKFAFDNTLNLFSFNLDQDVNNSTQIAEFVLIDTLELDSLNSDGMDFSLNTKNLAVDVDLVKSRRVSFSWTTHALCGGCSLSLSTARIKDNYINLTEDSVSKNHSAFFTYKLSKNNLITLNYDFLDREFDESSQSESLRSYSHQIAYSHYFINHLSLKMFTARVKRKGDTLFSAIEDIVGIDFSYTF